MDAITLILNDHKRIKSLLSVAYQAAKRSPEKRKKIISDLEKVIVLHEKMEEKIWYPHLNAVAYKKIITHLIKEERAASKAINKLKKMNPDSDIWLKHFVKLKNDVEHHAKDEETKLLPKVKKSTSPLLLKYIGDKMLAFKNKGKK